MTVRSSSLYTCRSLCPLCSWCFQNGTMPLSERFRLCTRCLFGIASAFHCPTALCTNAPAFPYMYSHCFPNYDICATFMHVSTVKKLTDVFDFFLSQYMFWNLITSCIIHQAARWSQCICSSSQTFNPIFFFHVIYKSYSGACTYILHLQGDRKSAIKKIKP